MNKIKLLVITLVIIISVPTVVFGGSFTVSLIQGKTPSEAIEIIATQIDILIGRTVAIEEKQVELEGTIQKATLSIEEIEQENERLREELLEQRIRNDIQEEQRENDKYCEELSKVGSKYFPTRQPLKELYEAILRQNAVTFEEAYQEHVDGGAKVLSESEFRIEWQKGKDARDETVSKMRPYFDEYMSNCN